MGMKEIPLTQGKVAIVDDQDYDWLNQWKWSATWCKSKGGKILWYAVRAEGPRRSVTHIYMHRAIAAKGSTLRVDHRDGDGLNNQRHNLRLATASQNGANKVKSLKPCSSRFKGVFRDKSKGKWVVHLYFEDEVEAARAYDAAARLRFGEFACTNFAV